MCLGGISTTQLVVRHSLVLQHNHCVGHCVGHSAITAVSPVTYTPSSNCQYMLTWVLLEQPAALGHLTPGSRTTQAYRLLLLLLLVPVTPSHQCHMNAVEGQVTGM